jgi:NAD(P)-dependent dehydrogenase (short-subunit alcohol dehydrogenase family)
MKDFKKLFDLSHKVSIVTGGAGALGKIIINGLAQFGSDIVIVEMDIEGANEVAMGVESFGRRVKVIKTDVTQKIEVENMVNKVCNLFQSIDILVNCAGITRRSNAEEMSEKDWNDVINVNLNGLFYCCQAVGQVMIRQKGGKIINFASTVGLRGLYHTYDLASSYCASKGGVIQLTRALAAEWAKYNIHVNAVAPTYFLTEMAKPLLDNKEFYNYLTKYKIPLQRLGDPEELVGPVVFLASDASSMVEGHILSVDGGWSAI